MRSFEELEAPRRVGGPGPPRGHNLGHHENLGAISGDSVFDPSDAVGLHALEIPDTETGKRPREFQPGHRPLAEPLPREQPIDLAKKLQRACAFAESGMIGPSEDQISSGVQRADLNRVATGSPKILSMAGVVEYLVSRNEELLKRRFEQVITDPAQMPLAVFRSIP